MVYDEMHTMSLNIVKSALLDLLNDEDSGINWNIVNQRLNDIPWTTEFKSSRYPRNLTKTIGFWKAEDFSIFAYPISEVVFDGLLTDNQRQEWCCIARMVEFLQNHARNGWTEENTEAFHAMSLRYAVLLEERRGPHKCVIILHNLLHIKEDILNFSGLDNYSCWTKERAVKRYISQSSNCKNIEATFASTESRRECFKVKEENEIITINDPTRVDGEKVHNLKHIVLCTVIIHIIIIYLFFPEVEVSSGILSSEVNIYRYSPPLRRIIVLVYTTHVNHQPNYITLIFKKKKTRSRNTTPFCFARR